MNQDYCTLQAAKLPRTTAYPYMALPLPHYLSSGGLSPLGVDVVLASVGAGNLIMLGLSTTTANSLGLKWATQLLPLSLVVASATLLHGHMVAE